MYIIERTDILKKTNRKIMMSGEPKRLTKSKTMNKAIYFDDLPLRIQGLL